VRHERATEETRELAALYALGMLTQQQARSFEIHMQQGCPVCEAECRKYERIAASIGFSGEEADSPPYIRDLLLARLDREPQTVPEEAGHETKAAQDSIGSRTSPAPPVQSVLFQAPGKAGKRAVSAWVFAVGLCAALAIILAVYAWRLEKEHNLRLQDEINAGAAETADLRAQIEALKEKTGQLDPIASLASKPHLQVARLIEQDGARSSLGTIFWDKESNRCALMASFPPAPAGKVYQIWFASPTEKLPAGPIQALSPGSNISTVAAPDNAAKADVVIVTLESDSGVEIPSTPYYAVGRFN